jgi:hypothetical protein
MYSSSKDVPEPFIFNKFLGFLSICWTVKLVLIPVIPKAGFTQSKSAQASAPKTGLAGTF